jgi:hypothetical protein
VVVKELVMALLRPSRDLTELGDVGEKACGIDWVVSKISIIKSSTV